MKNGDTIFINRNYVVFYLGARKANFHYLFLRNQFQEKRNIFMKYCLPWKFRASLRNSEIPQNSMSGIHKLCFLYASDVSMV